MNENGSVTIQPVCRQCGAEIGAAIVEPVTDGNFSVLLPVSDDDLDGLCNACRN